MVIRQNRKHIAHLNYKWLFDKIESMLHTYHGGMHTQLNPYKAHTAGVWHHAVGNPSICGENMRELATSSECVCGWGEGGVSASLVWWHSECGTRVSSGRGGVV